MFTQSAIKQTQNKNLFLCFTALFCSIAPSLHSLSSLLDRSLFPCVSLAYWTRDKSPTLNTDESSLRHFQHFLHTYCLCSIGYVCQWLLTSWLGVMVRSIRPGCQKKMLAIYGYISKQQCIQAEQMMSYKRVTLTVEQVMKSTGRCYKKLKKVSPTNPGTSLHVDLQHLKSWCTTSVRFLDILTASIFSCVDV